MAAAARGEKQTACNFYFFCFNHTNEGAFFFAVLQTAAAISLTRDYGFNWA